MNTFSEIVNPGDFNVVADNYNLDFISGNQHNQNMVKMFKNCMKCQNVGDSWREHHPTEKNFTQSRGEHSSTSGLHFTRSNLRGKVINTSIKKN